jgi:hypothetical protein
MESPSAAPTDFVLTGVAALTSALERAGINTGIASVDPELAVILERALTTAA